MGRRRRKTRQASLSAREIGQRVRQMRQALGLSERDLAARAGTSQASISRLESGQRANFSWRTLENILRALGVRLRLQFDLPPGQLCH